MKDSYMDSKIAILKLFLKALNQLTRKLFETNGFEFRKYLTILSVVNKEI